MMDIFCTHYGRPPMDQGRLCQPSASHSEASPFSHGSEAVVLAMSIPTVHVTQDFVDSGLLPLPTCFQPFWTPSRHLHRHLCRRRLLEKVS